MAFSDLAHSQLRSLYGLSTGDVTHVTLDTRPSRFSACSIEKLGVAWGRGYMYVHAELIIKYVKSCDTSGISTVWVNLAIPYKKASVGMYITRMTGKGSIVPDS